MYAPCTPSINVTYDLVGNSDADIGDVFTLADQDNILLNETLALSNSSSRNSEML